MRRYVLAVTFLSLAAAAPTRAETEGRLFSVPHIKVPNTESIDVRPDIAAMRLSALSERPTMPEAAAENGRKTAKLLEALDRLGIDRADVTMAKLSLSPVWREQLDPAARRIVKREFMGYRAVNRLTARIRSVDRVAGVVAQLIATGVDEVDGVSFEVSDAEKYVDQLRPLAVANARKRAELYAQGGGLRLGRTLLIDIDPAQRASIGDQADMPRVKQSNEPRAVIVPIEPGMITISTSVEVTWELSPDPAAPR